MEKVDQAVIIMAGLGTRFLPATKAVPKEMFPIFNKPALMYQMQELYNAGIKRVCLIISKQKDSVKAFFKHDKKLEESLKNLGRLDFLTELNEIIDNMEVSFVYQGKRNGTAGALSYAEKWAQNKPFAVLYGDDLFMAKKSVTAQLCEVFEKTGKSVTAVKQLPIELVPRYSSVKTGKKLLKNSFEVLDIIEKPKNPPTNLISFARYVLSPEIFSLIKDLPKHTNGEQYIPDALAIMAKDGKLATCEVDGTYYDCGNKLEYTKCIIDNAMKDKNIKSELLQYMKSFE